MSSIPIEARSLTAVSSADLERLVRQGSLPGEGSACVQALRAEVSRCCHTDAAEGRRVASRALELAQLLGDSLTLGWGHRAVAESLLFSGRMREADGAYRRAAACWREVAPGLLGQLLVGHIHVLSLLGRGAEVVKAVREARRNLEKSGDYGYLAKLAMNLGNDHFQHDRYGPALEEIDRAGEIFRRLGVRDETVLSLEVNRGNVLSQLDRDEEAIALFDRIEAECGRRRHALLQAQVRMNVAVLRAQRAEFGPALRNLAAATAYFQRTEHPSFLAECHLNRAEIYHQLNLHQDALDLARKAVPLFEGEGLQYDKALAISQEVLSLLALGDPKGAMKQIRLARSLFWKMKNPPRVALMELLHAEALHLQHRPEEAEGRARHAAEAFARLGLIRWESRAIILYDRIVARSVPPNDRVIRLESLLQRLPGRLYPIPTVLLLEAIGSAHEEMEDAAGATKAYRRALRGLEDLRIRIPTEDSKIAFLRDKTHLHDRLLALELARKSPSSDRIFDLMEKARAQSLWDWVRDPAAFLEPDRGRERSLVAARRRLAWLHTRLSRLELGTAEQLTQAADLKRRLRTAEAQWARALREQREAEPERPRTRRETDQGLSALSRDLPEGWGFIGYHIGPGFSLALVLTREGARWRRLADDLGPKLRLLADRLDFQWQTAAMLNVGRSPETARAAAVEPSAAPDLHRIVLTSANRILEEMHQLLWAPLAGLGVDLSRRWIVSPHGEIHRLPLHALRDGNGYLAEKTDIAIVPSVRIWRALSRRGGARAGKRTAYVCGVPSPSAPAVEREVEGVVRYLQGWKTRSDLAPTRASLSRHGRHAGLVHIAAHGSLRRDNPAYSYVQLADGPLFVHDLASLHLPGSLVVLTACSSARGMAPSGDEWIGLAQGFLQAGASSVVASLWPIQDEATAELMELFYRAIGAGAPASVALGEAMRVLMRTRPHPWHWASFAALGGVWQ